MKGRARDTTRWLEAAVPEERATLQTLSEASRDQYLRRLFVSHLR